MPGNQDKRKRLQGLILTKRPMKRFFQLPSEWIFLGGLALLAFWLVSGWQHPGPYSISQHSRKTVAVSVVR